MGFLCFSAEGGISPRSPSGEPYTPLSEYATSSSRSRSRSPPPTRTLATTVVPTVTAARAWYAALEARAIAAASVPTATAARATATATVVQTATAARRSAGTTARARATATVVQTATTATTASTTWVGPPEPWHGRHRQQSQFEIGYREGYSIRNPHVIFRPPASVLSELLGHAAWLYGTAIPGTPEHEVATMTRDWLQSIE